MVIIICKNIQNTLKTKLVCMIFFLKKKQGNESKRRFMRFQ